ncbi:hypothetical protein E1301_Tti019091 [Triplophysa tibetana]|uniref:Uncharacterized protein n=1 Tax=Triplophysa tibetana TaxID=1572043 RepID=A0A5A9NSR7_9TELE|nr:hypothetical protein E1301_Tti019091 [Triplophysa tibetana]
MIERDGRGHSYCAARVGGAICLVDSDNERDSPLLNSYAAAGSAFNFLEGQVAFSHARRSDNRSVMPLDVRGCTRATMGGSVCVYPAPRGAGNPLNPALDRDRGLQLFPTNEEFPVGAGHEPASIKSLPFVHTARRYYRSDGLARSSDRPRRGSSRPPGVQPPFFPPRTHVGTKTRLETEH